MIFNFNLGAKLTWLQSNPPPPACSLTASLPPTVPKRPPNSVHPFWQWWSFCLDLSQPRNGCNPHLQVLAECQSPPGAWRVYNNRPGRGANNETAAKSRARSILASLWLLLLRPLTAVPFPCYSPAVTSLLSRSVQKSPSKESHPPSTERSQMD